MVSELNQQVSARLYSAATVNPEAEAALTRFSRQTGIPVDALRQKPIAENAQRAITASMQKGIVQNSPNLGQWLASNQQHANIAHDDTDNLSLIDTLVNSFKRGWQGLKALPDVLQAVNQNEGLKQLDYVDQALAEGKAPDPTKLGVIGAAYAQADDARRREIRQQYAPAMQARIEQAVQGISEAQIRKDAIPLPPSIDQANKAKTFSEFVDAVGRDKLRYLAGIGGESLVQSLPGMLAAIPAGVTGTMALGPAGGTVAAGSVMGLQSALTEYGNSILSALQEAKVNIQDPEALKAALQDRELVDKAIRTAAVRAGVVGAFDALSGGLASKTLLPKDLLVKRPLARELANIGVQAPVQGAMGAAGEAAASAATGQEITFGALAGEFFGEFFGAPAEVVTTSAGRLYEQMTAAQNAKQDLNALKELDKLAAASKVRQRDVDTFENFMAQATEAGPVKDVYIDAQTLMQSGVGEQVAAVSPSVAEQLPAALAAGGTIRIPVAEYTARIAGTELNQPLIENLRIEPDGFSAKEAQEFLQTYQEDIKADVERALAGRQVDEAFKQSGKIVEDRVLAELEGAGRFKSDVNRAYAALHRAFAETMASKLGMTPEQFFDKHQLRVINKALGGQELDQPAFHGSPYRFSKFTLEHLGTGEGNQAYGWGLYFASRRDVADWYHAILTPGKNANNPAFQDAQDNLRKAYRAVGLLGFDSVYQARQGFAENADIWDLSDAEKARIQKAEDAIKEFGGQVYEVDVPEDDVLLLWDKPLSEQPEAVKQALEKLDWVDPSVFAEYTGQQFYENQVRDGVTFNGMSRSDAQREVSFALNKAGIKGLKYLDGSSRSAGEGSYNFVIFDDNAVNISKTFYQSAIPGGANAVTGDLSKVNPAVRAAVEERINSLPEEDQQRIRQNLEEHKSTAWAAAAVKGMAYRTMLERAMRGEDISDLTSNPIWGKQDMAASKLIQTFQKFPQHGDKILKVLLNSYDFIGGNRKAENDISTSFTNCDPSKACAIHCYAAGSNARPNEIAKSEFTEFMLEKFPQEMADKIAGDYLATAAGKADLSLRINDKGDLSPAQVELIKRLNDKGIAVQVFSKRPELLRELSDMNLKMLSVDGTNMDVAAANPDLRLAVVITDDITEEILQPIHDRVSVYLPVNLKGAEVTLEQLKDRFPNLYKSMKSQNLCPVDGGRMTTKPGTSFVDIRDKTAEKGVWTCTACDLFGNAGCFKGDRKTNQRKAQTVLVSDLQKELETKRVRKELQSNLDALLALGGIDGELHKQLVAALSSGQRAVSEIARLETEGELDQGTGRAVEAGDGGRGAARRDAQGRQLIPTQNVDELYQQARGSFNPATNTISLLKASDLSTFLHESGHFFLETQFDIAAQIAQGERAFGADTNTAGEQQILDDTNALLKWFGINSLDEWFTLDFEEKRAYHEKFAESFEAYLFEGKAPSIELQGAFNRFASWLKSVYKSLKDFIARNPAAGELNDEVRQVMDRMIATDEQIALAEQARSMMPLFTSPDQAGMTVDEFADYQAMGRDATAAAQEDLQAKAMRDLQWYNRAKQREVRKLKKLAAQRRSEVRIEARREIMSQPVYQAWQFLTGKLTPDDKLPPPKKSDPNSVDPERDSLFVAIAKLGGLNRKEVEDTWGWDPAARTPVPAFGKPLLRREGGRTIDAMGEALSQYGYLTLDQNGKWDNAELEDMFGDEQRGKPRYSSFADYSLLADMPAGSMVNVQGLGAGRFDLGELRTMDIPSEITDLIVGLKMTAKNGLHPDIVAERFGFTSGDDLVRSLAYAEAPKVAIEALTDSKMLEQFGELSSEEAIAREADKAIHNDLRARMLATEANALAKATGQRKVLAPAAKAFAAQMIARLKVRDVKPGQYTSAEARAGKAAEKAMRAGKLTEAGAEKRNQLVNNYAAKAAYQALDDVERGVRYLKKFEREATRNAIATEYVEQIDALLERFDLRKMSNKAIDKRASLVAWIDSQREMGLEPNIPEDIANEAMRKPYREMTVEEFRGLIDTVRQIEHLGRLKEKLLTAKDKREFKAVQDLIVQSINDNAGDRRVNPREARTDLERAQETARKFGWAHIKASTIARILDGGKDGGPVWEYFIRSANEAGDREVAMRAKATEDITRILEPVFRLGKLGGKGQFFPSLGISLNRESRIALALNVGNEGNLQRLLGGEGWTMQQIQPVLQSLTAAEWQTVQNIWDYFESYRPEIAAKERRVYGKEPNWIEPKPFTITAADGQQMELTGGYYPIKYDRVASQRAEAHADADAAKRQLQGAYTSATTRRSFTKARAEEVSGRPLLLSLAGVYAGLNEVIHDLSWHEWLIDVNRLLKAPAIDTAIRTRYGAEFKSQLKSWIEDVAEGDRPAANAAESALSRLRQGVSAAGLGFNVMNAMMQVTGFIPAGVRIGWKWMGKGASRYIGGPITATKRANELSSFMQNRARTRLRELNEVRNRVQDANQTFTRVNEMAYFLMLRTQQVVDTVTWWGAFEKAMAEGNSEERAIGLSDQAVLDSQGGGQLKDLSANERGGPALKLFTVYYSYMNTMLNLGVAEQMTNKQRGKRLANQLLIFTVAPMLGLAIKEGLTPGGDDEWDWGKIAKKMAAEQIAYLMGLMIVVREFSDAAKMVAGVAEYSRDYSGPAGLRAVSEIQKLSTQINQGDVDEAFVRASVNTIGTLTGLPAAQVNRTIAGATALAEDKTDNPAALVLGYQK